jgi:hypothetical protein
MSAGIIRPGAGVDQPVGEALQIKRLRIPARPRAPQPDPVLELAGLTDRRRPAPQVQGGGGPDDGLVDAVLVLGLLRVEVRRLGGRRKPTRGLVSGSTSQPSSTSGPSSGSCNSIAFWNADPIDKAAGRLTGSRRSS